VDSLSPVESTLAVPLRWRSVLSRDATVDFSDPVAEELTDQIGIGDLPVLQESWMTDMLTRRVQIIDGLLLGLLDQEPTTLMVNVGAGLCTRKYRLPATPAPWVDLDSAPVIGLRRRLLAERPPRSRFLVGALEDDGWMRYLPWSPGDPIAFVAEGVLGYLAERDVRLFLERIAEMCPGAHVIFDTCSPGFAERANAFSKEQAAAVRVRWAPVEPTVVRSWHRHLLVASVQITGPGSAVVHVRARR
jgi:O-methyltransferase involved in polyketide biosynthesis